MLTAIRWRLFLHLLLIFLHFFLVKGLSVTQSYECLAVQQQQKRSIERSNFDDISDLRKLGYQGDVHELPVDIHRDLLKMTTFPTALPTGANISQKCVGDSLFYMENFLFHGSEWAIKMYEATGRIPASIVGAGNHHAQGLFDECQAIRSVPYRFRGQYCTIIFKLKPVDQSETFLAADDIFNTTNVPPVLFILRQLFGPSVGTLKVEPKLSLADIRSTLLNYPSLDVCLPSSCSASDLGQTIAHMIGSYVIDGNKSIVTVADENLCFTDDRIPPPLDVPAITVITVLGLIVLLVLLATVHESWRIYHGTTFVSETDNTFVSILNCFSALRNGRKLLSTKKTSCSSDISCLHGIRFVTTCWVIASHVALKISALGSNYILNPNSVEQEAINNWMVRPFGNPTMAVDTFFLISGFLMAFYFLKQLDCTSGKFNIGTVYFTRYLRLTPVYAAFLAAGATLAVYVGKGPTWFNLILSSEACRNNWWQHLLYINNMFQIDPNKLCMIDTWYLDVDMQLFLVAPFLIYILWRWKKCGLSVLAILILASLATNFFFLFTYNLPPTLIPVIKTDMLFNGFLNYLDLIYSKPWTRAPPYLIGIFVGWYLYGMKNNKSTIALFLVASLWVLSIGITTSVAFGIVPHVDDQILSTYDWIAKLIYGTVHRTVWALAVAWIIFACICGYGGPVNRFLSWKGFFPVSRLTYCAYLVQFNYINLYYALSRKMFYFTVIDQFTTFLGFTVTIFGLAFVVSILYEGPFLSLLKLAVTPKTILNNQVELEQTAAISEKLIRETPSLEETKSQIVENGIQMLSFGSHRPDSVVQI